MCRGDPARGGHHLLRDEALGAEVDEVVVKPITVTVNFMRGGTNQDTFAAGTVTRIGNRIANVEAHAWQDDRSRPIASKTKKSAPGLMLRFKSSARNTAR